MGRGKFPIPVCVCLSAVVIIAKGLRLGTHVVPVSLPCHAGGAVVHKAVLKVVEDGKLIPGHDV